MSSRHAPGPRRPRRNALLGAVGFALAAAGLLDGPAAATASAGEPSAPGPFAVGTSVRSVARDDGSSFTADLYYPALADGSGTPPAPSAGPAPIVTFGHGFLQPVSQYDSTLRHLASHGYLVIASRSAGGFFPNHLAFARDLSWCIDHLLAAGADPGSPFFGLVSPDRFASSGHSMGGGASVLCASLDARVRAVANLAAAETSTSAIAAAATLDIPLRFIVGDSDGITPTGAHAGPMFEAAPGARQLVTIVGGFHCGFTDGSFFGCDSGGISRAEQLARTRALLVRFLDLHLKADRSGWTAVWGPVAPAVVGTDQQADPRIAWTEVPGPGTLEAVAGSVLAVPVAVRNDRPGVADLRLRVEGPGFGDAAGETVLSSVPGGATAAATLEVPLPEDLPAGPVTIRLVVEAGDLAHAWVEASLTVNDPAPAADLDGDGVVAMPDLLIVLAAWGPCGAGPCPADLDGDGAVGLGDLLAVLAAWA